MNKNSELIQLSMLWENVDDVMSTDNMKAAGEKYLPREPQESPINYKLRLGRTVLFPAYARSIKNAIGKVFNKPMSYELPDNLSRMAYDFDGQGSTIESFAKTLSEKAVHYGIAYALLDMPREGGTPYAIYISPRDVVRIDVDWIGNQLTLVDFAFEETYVDEGKTRTQIKQFTLEQDEVMFYTWRRPKKDRDYEIVDSGVVSGAPGVIPLVPVYGNKVAPFYGSPPLYDLYELNARHWAVYSDYANITHHSQVPMLSLKGFETEFDEQGNPKPIVISSNTVFKTSEGGSVEWVEVSGAAATVGKEMLADLEQKMAVTGLQLFLNTQNAHRTATESVLDAAEESSMLKSITLDIESALNLLLEFAAMMTGSSVDSVSVQLDKDYTTVRDQDFQHVMSMHEMGIVSAEDVLKEARARNIFKSQE